MNFGHDWFHYEHNISLKVHYFFYCGERISSQGKLTTELLPGSTQTQRAITQPTNHWASDCPSESNDCLIKDQNNKISCFVGFIDIKNRLLNTCNNHQEVCSVFQGQVSTQKCRQQCLSIHHSSGQINYLHLWIMFELPHKHNQVIFMKHVMFIFIPPVFNDVDHKYLPQVTHGKHQETFRTVSERLSIHSFKKTQQHRQQVKPRWVNHYNPNIGRSVLNE